MDPVSLRMFMGAAGSGISLPDIGAAFEGGYYAGSISHTADGVATHALIVAPAATGASGTGYTITANKYWQSDPNSNTGATSSYDGASNTTAMTNSTAASFCSGLTIGGYSDWYLPAPQELEIAYYYLKPTTDNNSTGWGTNNRAVPQRGSNYTTSNPGRTSVSAFQSGGAQAFVASAHWTSRQRFSTSAWRFSFQDGSQDDVSRTDLLAVRAFRKIAL